MTAVGPNELPRCPEIDDNCKSRKFVSKHVYPVTGPDPPMCEVGRVSVVRFCVGVR